MVEKVKITGTIKTDANYNIHHGVVDLRVGLSLRDLFAAFALAGILAKGHGNEGLDAEVAGADAYFFADAAITAREGKE